jgi:hypothetical protein
MIPRDAKPQPPRQLFASGRWKGPHRLTRSVSHIAAVEPCVLCGTKAGYQRPGQRYALCVTCRDHGPPTAPLGRAS